MERTTQAIGQSVTKAIKLLLSENHLYQYVEVDLSAVFEFAKTLHADLALASSEPNMSGSYKSPPSLESLNAQGKLFAANLWMPSDISLPTLSFSRDESPIGFELPTINTFCAHCKERWPFNPVRDGSYMVQGEGQDECFYLGFQCQQCKGRPIRFLVCREGLRLRLAGRYPIEVLPTPKVLPKGVNKFYSDAMVAHHAGQTLAGLFLLRVFIEQFWRTVPAVQQVIAVQQRANGDEQGDAYQSTLPTDFKSRFASLKDVYGKLSEAIHAADGNANLFDDSCARIVEHFDARRLYRL